jgi:hypothetical protein
MHALEVDEAEQVKVSGRSGARPEKSGRGGAPGGMREDALERLSETSSLAWTRTESRVPEESSTEAAMAEGAGRERLDGDGDAQTRHASRLGVGDETSCTGKTTKR